MFYKIINDYPFINDLSRKKKRFINKKIKKVYGDINKQYNNDCFNPVNRIKAYFANFILNVPKEMLLNEKFWSLFDYYKKKQTIHSLIKILYCFELELYNFDQFYSFIKTFSEKYSQFYPAQEYSLRFLASTMDSTTILGNEELRAIVKKDPQAFIKMLDEQLYPMMPKAHAKIIKALSDFMQRITTIYLYLYYMICDNPEKYIYNKGDVWGQLHKDVDELEGDELMDKYNHGYGISEIIKKRKKAIKGS